MCAIITKKWKLSHVAKDHHPTHSTFSSLCMMFLLLEMIATMNNTVTIPAGLSGNMNKLMLRITTKCNLCVRVLMMTRVFYHIPSVCCISHLAWPQIKCFSKYNVNSFLFCN